MKINSPFAYRRMPHFYTHIENGHGYQQDDDGAECPSFEAAHRHAIASGADIIAEELKQGCRMVSVTLYIDNAVHERLAVVPMTVGVQEPDFDARNL